MARPQSDAAPTTRAPYHSFQQESELVVAIFRTAMILLAVLAPFVAGVNVTSRLAMQVSVLGAAVYNVIVFFFYLRHVRFRGQRELMVLVDILLVTTWVYLTWNPGPGDIGSPLFALYYLVVIISALWLGVPGSLVSAGLISLLYLLVAYTLSGSDPFALIHALYNQVVYVFLVGMLSGYLIDTHLREREQWTRSQVLLAQYQERFRAAQEVYELLIPAQTPAVPSLDLAARWRPALQEGGGDFYDVVVLDDGRVVITIADVAGKHTRGAIKLPLFKAAFLASAQVWDDPGEVLAHVNRIVYPLLQPDMFISACVIIIDPAANRLRYANAGQDPPVFVRQATREPVLLETGGLLLGIEQRASYPSEEQSLEDGDTLCLYTDGITEARNPQGEEFGYAAMEARVQAAVSVGLPADAIADNLMDAVTEYIHGEARHDDMTLVVLRYRPKG